MSRKLPWLVAIVCVALAQASLIQMIGWNQTSHYALVNALDRGTARIDRLQATTGDKARYHGHWYSARAPGLAFFALPEYKALRIAGATAHPRVWLNRKHNDVAIWLVTLWGAVLPAAVMLLLVRRAAESLEPGYGTATAIALGLGTLILPFGTLLFSHVFSALLAFAAFAVLWRERKGRGRLPLVAGAGLLVGFGVTTEYPILFAGVILGIYALLRPLDRVRRAAVYTGGVIVGMIPLALYDKLAYGSFTHIAYADIPKQHRGFFGINLPSPKVAVELLGDSRGLFTLAPVLLMAVAGLVLMYRRGRRAEAGVITAVCVVYLAYNSGYYLPFGGQVPGPRFLITVLPFLAVPLALAFRRFPGPTIALAGASVVAMTIPTVTHPMVSAEGDTGMWTRLAGGGQFQATIATLAGVKEAGVALAPFLVPVVAALAIVASITRFALPRRQIVAGVVALGAWVLWAALMPGWLRIDHWAGLNIVHAGDPKGTLLKWGSHPIVGLVLVAAAGGLTCLFLAKAIEALRARGRRVAPAPRERVLVAQ
jgi:hypothetical protein